MSHSNAGFTNEGFLVTQTLLVRQLAHPVSLHVTWCIVARHLNGSSCLFTLGLTQRSATLY